MTGKERKKLPDNLEVLRGETEKNANRAILTELINRYEQTAVIDALDLPCGNLEYLKPFKTLFPNANISGADIIPPSAPKADDHDFRFYKMDLTRDFLPLEGKQYDLITSISGIMMFSNTLRFIENCSRHVKTGGTFIITNDNNSTIIDRIEFLFLGKYRMFKAIFEDDELLTENVPIQEVVRLLRKNNIEIERIEYTSFYAKDLKYLPFLLFVYPIQMLYLRRIKTGIPRELVKQMFSPKHFFYRNYIIYGKKTDF